MALDQQLRNLMTQTVTVAPVSSTDEFGDRTYSTAVSYDARVVEELTKVVDFQGREAVATHTIWLAPHTSSGIPALDGEAKVTLPDATTPPLLSVTIYPGEAVDYYWKIFLGASR